MNKKCTVVNLKRSRYDVYIGRGSKWGNPYRLQGNAPEARDIACDKYEEWFWTTDLPSQLHELQGKVLGCYCKPLRCHGDFLAREANRLSDKG